MGITHSEPSKKASFFFPWLWALYFLALWWFLLRAQNPGLMADDSGEMAAAAFRLGLPHPPGYPLLTLAGRLLAFIPLGTFAFRLNLLASFFSLMALGLLLAAFRKQDSFQDLRRKFGTVLPEILLLALGLYFISSRNILAQSLTAKGGVYTLTLLFSAAFLWLGTKGRGCRPWASWFLWALGLANHWQTQILWLPFLLLGFFREPKGLTVKNLARLGAFLLLGLSLYLYLPLRAALGVQPFWGNPVHWRGFYWVVSRQLVRGSENWFQPPLFYLHSLEWILRTFGSYFFSGLTALALWGAFYYWRKGNRLLYDLAWLGLPVLAAVAMVHEERNQYLVPVYLVALAGVWWFAACEGAFRLVTAFSKKRAAAGILLSALALGSLVWMERGFRLEEKSRYTLAEDFGTNVLKGLPRNALFLADGDHYVMSLWYGQFVKEQRPDVVFEPSIFLYHDWGWRHLSVRGEDLRGAIESSPLFTGRIGALCGLYPRRPFFYSLGRDYLQPVLDQVPGQWVPAGLASQWRPPGWKPRGKAGKPIVEGGERFRGLEDFGEIPRRDPSSLQIFRYYAAPKPSPGP